MESNIDIDVVHSTDDQTPIEALLQIGEDGKVSARATYEFLDLTDGQFSRWSKPNITENQFAVEGEDFTVVDINVDVRNNFCCIQKRDGD